MKIMELKNNYALYIPSTINGEYISDGKLAERVKSEMEQEAVSYEINGVLHII